jgi:hypothetical protein
MWHACLIRLFAEALEALSLGRKEKEKCTTMNMDYPEPFQPFEFHREITIKLNVNKRC